MSKSTLRKRIALTATTALFAGMLSFVATPSANAAAGDANVLGTATTTNGSLIVATMASEVAAAVNYTAVDLSTTTARSKGLLVKDSTSGTAQTATMLAGGKLALYAPVSTTSAFTATGGSFASTQYTLNGAASTTNVTYNSGNTVTLAVGPAAVATAIATLWTAPTTVGTYSVKLYVGNGIGTVPSLTSPAVTLAGQVTVTVVAASAGGTYSAAYSACNTSTIVAAATGVDSTSAVSNNGSWQINFDLDDGYDVSLGSGNIVVSATNGGIVNLGSSSATATAGTNTTAVEYGSSQARSVRIDQPTAGAPLTTTVTISFNGTVVCTKTVTIRGEVASLEVTDLLTGDLSTTNAGTDWGNRDATSRLGALGYFVAKDSAGNIVDQDDTGLVAVDSATK